MADPHDQAFMEAFRREAGDSGRLPFDHFMRLALFHPALGYYASDRRRVGASPDTDFITSSSAGPLFGELVAAAAAKLVKEKGASPEALHFVEIGSETEQGVLEGVPHPFASARTLRLGAPLVLSGPSIVFSNELFDAQPCRRFLRREGLWLERGVSAEPDGGLAECELGPVSEPWLPIDAPEGYAFDAPREAARLAAELAGQDWSGLFLAFDYGKSLETLTHESPFGTLRAYHRHTQEKDLLARPGEQDLTCHVCWDWLQESLRAAGFGEPRLESQESFFVHHASDFIGAQVAADAGRPTRRKMALLQLIHPGNLGQKFQALHAWRDRRP